MVQRLSIFMLLAKADVLKALHEEVSTRDLSTKEDFHDLMEASFSYADLPPRQLANDLGFSPASVKRWIQRKAAAHPSLWEKITEWIISALEEKIEGNRLEADRLQLAAA